jgi:ribosomal protein S18 acetylase RimI-like enzyme
MIVAVGGVGENGWMAVRWTGASDSVLDAWVLALAEIEAVDRSGEVIGRAELEEELGLSYVDPALDVRLGWDGPRVVAWGSVLCIPSAHQRRVLLDGAVVPDRRRCGLGTELLAWQVGRGADVVAARGRDCPAWLEVSASVGDTGREALFGVGGFAPLRYYLEMRRPLRGIIDADLPEVPVRIRPYDRAVDDLVRVAHNEAFRDHFAASELDDETWRTWVTDEHHFRPDCSFIAFDGEEVAGYAINAVHPDDWPGLGFTEGWTHHLGVRRPWRGNGVARSLLRATAAAFAREGLDYAALDVDAENPTGALALYEAEGYRREKTRVAWSRAVV